MSNAVQHQTTVHAPAGQPVIEIVREFDAEPARVFRAHVDPDLFARWVGPRDIETRVERWDARTGGAWRYTAHRDGEEVAAFYGSFHEVRADDRLVQTFTWEGAPDEVALEVLSLEELAGGRTRLRAVSVGESVEARDAMVASGMEVGVVQGYEKLDALLTELD